MCLAEGKAVDQCLVEGACILAPEFGPEWAQRLLPPLRVLGFRAVLAPRSRAGGKCAETVQAMWAVLFPVLVIACAIIIPLIAHKTVVKTKVTDEPY